MLQISTRKCEEMEERILNLGREIEHLRREKFDADQVEELMWSEIRTLRRQKLGVAKKLESSNRKCEEMDESLLNIGREIEALRQQKSYSDRIEKLMWNEIGNFGKEKLGFEKKLESSNRKCEEMDARIVNMGREIEHLRLEKFDAKKTIEELTLKEIDAGEKIGILMYDKLCVEEKLKSSNRKCEEMEEKLLKTGREIEDLRREKFDANQTMENLKRKEIEADRVSFHRAVQDVDKNYEVSPTTNELRVPKMNLAHPGTEGGAENVDCTYSRSVPACNPHVSESRGTIPNDEEQEPQVEVEKRREEKKRIIGYDDKRGKKRKTMANLNLTALSKKVNRAMIFSKECFICGVEGDEKLVVYQGLKTTGILPFIRAKPKLFYPQAVAEFYARAVISPDGLVILSTVQNQAVMITRKTLAKCFKLPTAGADANSYRVGEEELAGKKMSSSRLSPSLKSELKPVYQALFYIAIKMVMGHLGKTSRLSNSRSRVMMALEDGAAIDWASYVFNRLKGLIAQSCYSPTTGDFKCSVGYGLQLSYLLEHMLKNTLSGGRALYVSDYYMKKKRS